LLEDYISVVSKKQLVLLTCKTRRDSKRDCSTGLRAGTPGEAPAYELDEETREALRKLGYAG
jgi:hypothetical protein